jgi:hypothetical protein
MSDENQLQENQGGEGNYSAATLSTSSISSDITLVDEVKVELSEIDASDLSEHAARFDALHQKLQQSLSSIDGL